MKEIGEFCYEVNIEVGLPKPFDRLDFSTNTSSQTTKTLRIGSKNLAFEKAFSILAEMRIKNPNKKIKARSVLQNFISSPIANEETGHSNFVLEFFSSFFQYKKQINFVSEYIQVASKGGGQSSPNNRPAQLRKEISALSSSHSTAGAVAKKAPKMLKTTIEDSSPEDFNPMNETQMLNSSIISFYPERAGHYSSMAVVYAKDNLFDVRVLEVNAKVTMPDGKMVIEFRGPARELIYQDIPIANESDKDWYCTLIDI